MAITDYFPEPRFSMMKQHLRQFSQGFGLEPLEPAPRLANTKRILAAAEYAREQGRLDEFRSVGMHAYWREGRGVETDEEIRYVAEKAGLDGARAVAAADDPVYVGRMRQFLAEGRTRGVTGIPTFFIGPYRVVGCQPYEVLAEAAQRAGAKRRDGA